MIGRLSETFLLAFPMKIQVTTCFHQSTEYHSGNEASGFVDSRRRSEQWSAPSAPALPSVAPRVALIGARPGLRYVRQRNPCTERAAARGVRVGRRVDTLSALELS